MHTVFRSGTRYHILVLLAAISALVACHPARTAPMHAPATSTIAPLPSEPAELVALRARPLHVPQVAAGEACPATQPVRLSPAPPAGGPLSTGGSPSVLGHAPLFPDARYFTGRQHQLLVTPDPNNPGWYGTKAPWSSGENYQGWALVRIVRLDGPGEARLEFDLGEATYVGAAIPIDVQAAWQFWPGSTYTTGAGCYAYQIDTYQIDGAGFSEVVVFQVELAR